MSEQQVPTAGVPSCYRHPGRETYIRCQRCERSICPDCMRDAAVGFHCPTCVAEGAKSTRSGRTAYGGLRPTNAGITSMVIIALNAAVWLMLTVAGDAAGRLYAWLALLPTTHCASAANPGGVYPLFSEAACQQRTNVPGDGIWATGVADGAYWQLLSSAFTHLELWHIGFNMLALWVLGPQLELAIGRARFLALYLLSALSGSVLVYWLEDPTGSTIGASGAVFGLMGGLLVLAVKVRGDVRGILTWVGINAVITFLFPNISWQGHLGGFLGGVLIAAMLVYAPRQRRTTWQVLGLAVLTACLVAATAARTVVLS